MAGSEQTLVDVPQTLGMPAEAMMRARYAVGDSPPAPLAARGSFAVGDAKPTEGSRDKYLLKLYVTGSSPRAEVAIANLRAMCEQELRGQYRLEIIDVLEHPQRAEDDKILVTPTLIKQLPPPLRRVIGDLTNKEKVLLGLEVRRDTRDSGQERDGQ
jgi:circadian clock protein KaiB